MKLEHFFKENRSGSLMPKPLKVYFTFIKFMFQTLNIYLVKL